MTDNYVCELCQWGTTSEDAFYEHLSAHSRKEVLELREIAKKKLNMTSDEEKDFNFRLMKDWLRKKQLGMNQ